MGNKITVLGAGSMGTAVSVLLGGNGHDVTMWSIDPNEVYMLNTKREQVDKLPGVIIPDNVSCTGDIEEALKDTDMVVVVIPSQTVRKNAQNISKYIKNGQVIVSLAKGLEMETCYRMTEVIKQEIPQAKVAALSGPCHAEELGKGMPSAYVAASEDKETAQFVQDVFMSSKFRVYTNSDIIGVELGGALKNVIALCAGISDGLGFGDNTKAMLMTRGITEISRLGVAMGAKAETFSGLTGVGDLIVTCTSMHSRNRRAGILIGQGKTAQEAMDEVKMVVEGISTTKAAYELSKHKNVVMPITEQAYEVLFNGKNVRLAVTELMGRSKKHEIEEVAEDWGW